MRGKRNAARDKGSRRHRNAAKQAVAKKKSRTPRKPMRRKAAAHATAKGARQGSPAVRDPLIDYVDAAARVLDLAIAPEWKGAIAANYAALLRLSASFMEFPLPDDAEPAPTFKA